MANIRPFPPALAENILQELDDSELAEDGTSWLIIRFCIEGNLSACTSRIPTFYVLSSDLTLSQVCKKLYKILPRCSDASLAATLLDTLIRLRKSWPESYLVSEKLLGSADDFVYIHSLLNSILTLLKVWSSC